MENRAFDDLTKSLAASPSRRGILQGVIGSLAGSALLRLGATPVDAAKCSNGGQRCERNSDCCSRKCRGRRDRQRCAAGGTGTTCRPNKANKDCKSKLCACGQNPDANTCQGRTYRQGFEKNLKGWYDADANTGAAMPPDQAIKRVESGENGIVSKGGGFHAEVATGTTYDPDFDLTAFSTLGGYSSEFNGGFDASIDIFIDPTSAPGDTQFDYTVAASRPDDCLHRRDFIFTGGTNGDGSVYCVSASNNAPGWACNPDRDPEELTTAGWYTFVHEFRDLGNGVLEVTMKLFDENATHLNTWILSQSSDVIGTEVGGNRYGWFPVQEFAFLAIDNVERRNR